MVNNDLWIDFIFFRCFIYIESWKGNEFKEGRYLYLV